ncbi:hypothetical protein CYY_005672, partial [Polysphondylium violaceum]
SVSFPKIHSFSLAQLEKTSIHLKNTPIKKSGKHWKRPISKKQSNTCLKNSTPVLEGGDGLSVGQKQLLCLSRALLRNAKIVLMDEATASLDYHTDYIIKQTIKMNFQNSTVLTIAHRLDTIIDSDKILVIDQGQLVEFDSPQNLINNPTSRFSQIVNAQTTFYK